MTTITITFSECVENHKGMQTIGIKSPYGYSIDELIRYKNELEKLGHKTELLSITYEDERAALLIIRNAVFGDDWRCSSKYTLRHAAGADKYTALE